MLCPRYSWLALTLLQKPVLVAGNSAAKLNSGTVTHGTFWVQVSPTLQIIIVGIISCSYSCLPQMPSMMYVPQSTCILASQEAFKVLDPMMTFLDPHNIRVKVSTKLKFVCVNFHMTYMEVCLMSCSYIPLAEL